MSSLWKKLWDHTIGKRQKTASAGPEQIFDFLYSDSNRISRLVTQLNGRGVATGFEEEIKRQNQFSADLGWSLAKAGLSTTWGNTGTWTYDMSWSLPSAFLSAFSPYISPLPDSNIGELIQITGKISFFDFPFLLRMLKVPEVAAAFEGHALPIGAKWSGSAQEPNSPLSDFLPVVLEAGKTRTWATVNTAFTTASTGDLTLKYGECIAGEWVLTGFLDATPGTEPAMSGSGYAFDGFGTKIRELLGRPTGYYGVTPLTIHRTLILSEQESPARQAKNGS